LDPAHFSRERFAWDPYPYQQDVLDAVLLQDKRRIAWVAGRRVGKTEGVANLVLQLAVREPGIEVVIFAPSFRQAKVLSRKVRYMLAGSPWEDRTTVDNVRELRLGFGTDADGKPVESVIMTMSLSGKARGEAADVLVVDESAFCEAEDDRSKVLPFVVDREEPVVVHISTVWAEDDHFMQAYDRYGDLDHGFTMRTPTREKPGVTEASWRSSGRRCSAASSSGSTSASWCPRAGSSTGGR
jgi:phage terminase large subunit-like protein